MDPLVVCSPCFCSLGTKWRKSQLARDLIGYLGLSRVTVVRQGSTLSSALCMLRSKCCMDLRSLITIRQQSPQKRCKQKLNDLY
jgi:hypothetical protein